MYRYLLFMIFMTSSLGCGPGDSPEAVVLEVTCNETLWDVGEVGDHELSTLSHDFVLKNNTNQEVPISVDADCGCLTTNFPELILPGQEAVVATRLALSPEDTGPFHRRLRVNYGKSSGGSLDLLIRGIIRSSARLVARPGVIQFGSMNANKQASRTVRISRIDNSPIHYLEASSTIPGATVSCEIKENGSLAELSLTLHGLELEPTASRRPIVTVATNHAQYPSLEIPVDWTLVSRRIPIRNAIVLKSFQVGSTRRVRFVSSDSEFDEKFHDRVELFNVDSSPEIIVSKDVLSGGEIDITLATGANPNSIHKAVLQWVIDGDQNSPVSTTIVVFPTETVD